MCYLVYVYTEIATDRWNFAIYCYFFLLVVYASFSPLSYCIGHKASILPCTFKPIWSCSETFFHFQFYFFLIFCWCQSALVLFMASELYWPCFMQSNYVWLSLVLAIFFFINMENSHIIKRKVLFVSYKIGHRKPW